MNTPDEGFSAEKIEETLENKLGRGSVLRTVVYTGVLATFVGGKLVSDHLAEDDAATNAVNTTGAQFQACLKKYSSSDGKVDSCDNERLALLNAILERLNYRMYPENEAIQIANALIISRELKIELDKGPELENRLKALLNSINTHKIENPATATRIGKLKNNPPTAYHRSETNNDDYYGVAIAASPSISAADTVPAPKDAQPTITATPPTRPDASPTAGPSEIIEVEVDLNALETQFKTLSISPDIADSKKAWAIFLEHFDSNEGRDRLGENRVSQLAETMLREWFRKHFPNRADFRKPGALDKFTPQELARVKKILAHCTTQTRDLYLPTLEKGL